LLAIADSQGYITATYAGSGYDQAAWQGAGLTSRAQTYVQRRWETDAGWGGVQQFRHRAYDPATGSWIQEDPLGVAGGVNVYRFNNGNPVTFSDPMGMCTPFPECLFDAVAAWAARQGGVVGEAALNIAAGANAVSEAVGVNQLGAAVQSGDALSIGLAAAAFVPVGRGANAVGRALVRDAIDNPSSWRVVGAFTEPATNRMARGGTSIQVVLENSSGQRITQHTVINQRGVPIDGPHYRPMYKARAGDN